MKTQEEIRVWFECDQETAERIDQIQKRGYDHGCAGWYQEGDYSSDADWCYGVGAEIQKVENALDIDDGSVFDLYVQAHSEGLEKYLDQNPDQS